MRLRERAGTIWSVSTLDRFRGRTTPVTLANGSILARLPLADVHEVPRDRRSGDHLGAGQVCAPSLSLPPLEVAVGRGGAALARLEDVRVHPQAHRAARLPAAPPLRPPRRDRPALPVPERRPVGPPPPPARPRLNRHVAERHTPLH